MDGRSPGHGNAHSSYAIRDSRLASSGNLRSRVVTTSWKSALVAVRSLASWRNVAADLSQSSWIATLPQFSQPSSRTSQGVEIVRGSFLRSDLLRAPIKVFGNILFDKTHEIVRYLVASRVPPSDAYLIVRCEDPERIFGHPFATESRTSLLLKSWWHIEIIRLLRRSDFDSKPKVDSGFLWMARRSRPFVENRAAGTYKRFIEKSFGASGNALRQCIRPSLTGRQIDRLSKFLRLSDSSPPSALAFDQWLGLFRHASFSRRSVL